YAFKAVKAAGVTSIGVRGKDSVCVVTQKKVPDKLLDPTSVTHLFSVTKFLGLLATGTTDTCSLFIPADAREHWSNTARGMQAALFRFKYGYEMPVDALARWFLSVIPLGVVAMVLGIDDENGPKLFKCDPAGHFFGHKAYVLVERAKRVVNFLLKDPTNENNGI
ncbi:proteasome subunit alpha type-6, partial [Tanacetum coccineum]